MFTTEEYAHDYDSSCIPIHHVGDRYYDVSLNTLAQRLQGSIKRQAARLESIIDRLELIDEPLADRAAASVQQKRSKVFLVHGHDYGAMALHAFSKSSASRQLSWQSNQIAAGQLSRNLSSAPRKSASRLCC